MAVHHTVGISRQRNSGYKPSRVNIMAQGLSTPDPSLSPTHLYKERSRNTTLVPSLGLRIGPAYEAGLSAGMRRERVSPQIRKKERKKERRCKELSLLASMRIMHPYLSPPCMVISSSSKSSDFMGSVSSQLILPNSLLSMNLSSLFLKISSDAASTTSCGNRFQQFTLSG